MKKELTKAKIDLIEWLTCPHCRTVIFKSNPEMVGWLLKWKKQSDQKIKKMFKKRTAKKEL